MAGVINEEISKLKEGRYIVLDGEACVIKSMQRSAPGKHGHAKYRIEAVTLIGNSKKHTVITGHDKVQVPIVDKKSAQVLSITGDTAQIMDSETFETFNIKIPEDLKEKVQEGSSVVYWDILGQKILKQLK
jgi:translation initiation factor 5A